jgi:glycosyltransferase involved in cell wall biosynthesis
MVIAVPFYHQASYLREALASLVSQSDRDFSVVVLDDSIDPTETELARSMVSEFQGLGIRYLRNERNLGLGGNWNRALELAVAESHEFLLILHADDRLLPDYVRRVKGELRAHPEAEAVFVRTRIIDERGRPAFSLPDFVKERIRPKGARIELRGVPGVGRLIPGDFIFCPTICYRVSALGDRRFDPRRKQVLDFDWVVRSLFAGGIWIGIYDEPLFEYRRHSRNATKVQSEDFSRFTEEMDFYRDLSRELGDRGAPELARRAAQMWIVRLNLGFEALKALLGFKVRRTLRALRLMVS